LGGSSSEVEISTFGKIINSKKEEADIANEEKKDVKKGQ